MSNVSLIAMIFTSENFNAYDVNQSNHIIAKWAPAMVHGSASLEEIKGKIWYTNFQFRPERKIKNR